MRCHLVRGDGEALFVVSCQGTTEKRNVLAELSRRSSQKRQKKKISDCNSLILVIKLSHVVAAS